VIQTYLPGSNALAYFTTVAVTWKTKSFMTLPPDEPDDEGEGAAVDGRQRVPQAEVRLQHWQYFERTDRRWCLLHCSTRWRLVEQQQQQPQDSGVGRERKRERGAAAQPEHDRHRDEVTRLFKKRRHSPGAVFATLRFLHNLLVGQLSSSVALL